MSTVRKTCALGVLVALDNTLGGSIFFFFCEGQLAQRSSMIGLVCLPSYSFLSIVGSDELVFTSFVPSAKCLCVSSVCLFFLIFELSLEVRMS